MNSGVQVGGADINADDRRGAPPPLTVKYAIFAGVAFDNEAKVFDQLSLGMNREGGMLHPSAGELRKSYLDGDAVLAHELNGPAPSSTAHAIGYARLEPLLTAKLRTLLGVSTECPVVMEAGSMFVSPAGQYRGQGHLTQLCRTLFETRKHQLDARDLLVIGTTKHLAVLRSIGGCNIGAFVPCHHLDYPHLAALTCICSGAMGNGFQFSPECPERLPGKGPIDPNDLGNIPRTEGSTKATIPCTMFVSSRELASKADYLIAEAFRSLANADTVALLTARLRGIGFYPNITAPKAVEVTVNGQAASVK